MTIVVHLKSMLFAPSFAHYNTIMTVKIGCIYKLRLSLKSAEDDGHSKLIILRTPSNFHELHQMSKLNPSAVRSIPDAHAKLAQSMSV